ncbi:amyloid protein-binding protein 2-like isoform X2 [Dreissena polymorpha]|nr:amyloid protein-binding protein 2-like isoform X2 [Dreissena polymorpha]
MEFSELDTFSKVLKVNDKRHLLHHCFQALMDHGVRVSEILADSFFCQAYQFRPNPAQPKDKLIQLGFALGGFLSDAGWYADAGKVYRACLKVCQLDVSVSGLCKTLECAVRLLHVENVNCEYKSAKETCKMACNLIDMISAQGLTMNRATLHTECCALLFAESQYDEAYRHCCLAMQELSKSLPKKAVVDVLRQCSKACVVKREFKRAEVLIKYAVEFAREHFGMRHPKYSDALLDYGFYLLNVDQISAAVQVYHNALEIRQSVFGGNNLHLAVAHEDLAYASYVQEYSSGRFTDARDHSEKAIEILEHILPSDHLMLSSSKRVKALILEEIAIDSHQKEVEEKLLCEAQDLHLQSLALARNAFGENNVQTAKHYGNLGRLYQSMHKFEEAEKMHIQAIEIKERLLGNDDYEVALSVGHLASLYNYDMEKCVEAEKLYLRSIEIGKKLFGEGYSGLEYDYRGLLRLYRHQGNYEMAEHYANILQQWNRLRDRNNLEEVKPLEFQVTKELPELVTEYF